MKKTRISAIMTAVLAVVLCAVMTVFASAAALMGDMNNDGKVNSSDARTVLRAAAKLDVLTAEQAALADVNGDEKVNSSDARIILRMAAKLEPTVTVEESSEAPTTDPIVIPTAPSTEPPSTEPPSTEPPSTEPPVTEPPVTEPPVTEPPVTEPPVTEPEKGIKTVDHECYVDAVISTYDKDGGKSTQSMQFALQSRTEKKKTVYSYYTRSNSLFPGHDVGMLIVEKANLLGEVKQDYYMINYDTNEYMCLDSSLADEASAGAIDMNDAISVVTFDSLEGWNAEAVTVDGVDYQMVTITEEDGTVQKLYMQKLEGRDFYEPGIVESFDKDGNLTASMLIRKYDPEPAEYVKTPDQQGMNGFKVTLANMLLNAEKMLAFMESIGMN